MLATKQYLLTLYRLVYGPYLKRATLEYLIEGLESRSLVKSYSLSQMREGIQDNALCIAVEGDNHRLQVPSQAKIEILTLLGWKTLGDGKYLSSSQQTQTLYIPLSRTVRITLAQKAIVVSTRPEQETSHIEAYDWRNTLTWGMRGFGSLLAHVLAFVLLIYLNKLNFHFGSQTVELAAEKPQQMIDISPDLRGDFDGTNMAIGASGPSAQAVAEARAKAVSSGLSGIASKLSKLTFGTLNINIGSGGGNDKAMNSLQANLSKGQGSSLNADVAKMAQGIIGKGMKWGLYSSGNQGISQKDQEEVASIFRALQAEFRGCYESALLKDETLSVVVNYEAAIQNTGALGEGNYDMSGAATDQGQKLLTQCLSQVLRKVKVSRNLSGVKIKNQFIFKS